MKHTAIASGAGGRTREPFRRFDLTRIDDLKVLGESPPIRKYSKNGVISGCGTTRELPEFGARSDERRGRLKPLFDPCASSLAFVLVVSPSTRK
jgi:hypothetical protein